MNQIYILCVDDEPEVLEAVLRDLASFENLFPLEAAGSSGEARQVVDRLEKAGDRLGLIFCDHIMAGGNGVEFLVELQAREFTLVTRKVLVTAHAGLEDTIRAVNQAGLAQYIAKPWTREALHQVAREQLSRYFLEARLDPLPYLSLLDPMVLGPAMRHGFIGDR